MKRPIHIVVIVSIITGCSTAPHVTTRSVASDEAGSTPQIKSCSDLGALQQTSSLQTNVEYKGNNGFSFEIFKFSGTKGSEEITSCLTLERQLTSFVQLGIPGASMVIETPNFKFIGSQGVAVKGANTPMRPDQLIRAASTSKPYVGVLSTVLAEEGKLDLDNSDGMHSLADYLPVLTTTHGDQLTTDCIQNSKQITLREMLTHTSGIYDYYSELLIESITRYHNSKAGVSETDAFDILCEKTSVPSFPPGTMDPKNPGMRQAQYSNSNYLLMGMILNKVLHKHFSLEITKRFFKPLGMKDSYWEKYNPFNYNHEPLDYGRLVHGYQPTSIPFLTAVLGFNLGTNDFFDIDTGWGFANGGMISTVIDEENFFHAVFDNPDFPVANKDKFLKDFFPQPGYPLGNGIVQQDAPGCYRHDGKFTGYMSSAFHCMNKDVTGYIFINGTNQMDDSEASDNFETLKDSVTKHIETSF